MSVCQVGVSEGKGGFEVMIVDDGFGSTSSLRKERESRDTYWNKATSISPESFIVGRNQSCQYRAQGIH